MSPVSHFLISWCVANTADLERRDRAIVTLAGIAPDLDGLGVIPELLTRHSAHPLLWFSEYHHMIFHNLVAALAAMAVAALLARKRALTAGLALLTFHLHLFCDIIGARGPDGYQWPIPYLLPFSHREWSWAGQWPLNGWENFLITGTALLITFWLAWKRGYSPLEMVSTKADRAFVTTLRARFPQRHPV